MSEQGEQTTPYQRGYRAGAWTMEQVIECGWETVQACLENCERNYQEQIDGLVSLHESNPEAAARHAEYMEGVITASRETLGALMTDV